MKYVLRSGFLLTCAGPNIADAALAVDRGRIAWVGAASELPPDYLRWEQHDHPGDVVMPGLINCHAHAGLSTHRGICDRGGLFEWAAQLAPHTGTLTDADLEAGCEMAVRAMLASGTTTAVDCARFGAGIFTDVASAFGMRSLSGAMANSPELRPTGRPNWPLLLDETLQARGRHPDQRFYLGAHSPYSCTPELVREVKQAARHHDLDFNIHLAETEREHAQVRAQYGCTPVEWLHRLGVLDERTLLDHCVFVDDDDLDIIAASGAAVAHCPVSNAKLGSGVAPVPQMLERGIPVGLGTDSMLSNNGQDMFAEMKSAVLLQRAIQRDGTIYDSQQILEMATIGGARAIGWDDETGSLEAGKSADYLVMKTSHPRGTTEQRVLSDLVFGDGANTISRVVVRGVDVTP